MPEQVLQFNAEQLMKNMNALPGVVDHFLRETTAYFTPRVEAYAKEKAPWQDQTGNARQGLSAVAEIVPPVYIIVLRHGVPYGIWLEIRHDGKYAIILPTIRRQGRELMMTLRAALRGVHHA